MVSPGLARPLLFTSTASPSRLVAVMTTALGTRGASAPSAVVELFGWARGAEATTGLLSLVMTWGLSGKDAEMAGRLAPAVVEAREDVAWAGWMSDRSWAWPRTRMGTS